MSIQTVLLYLTTWALVALFPGPAVMCVMSQAVKYGLRAACIGTLGIQIGNLFFFIGILFWHLSNADISEPGRRSSGLDSIGPVAGVSYAF
jgi:threonine/homoserine/homoserine lactone efflux protein